MHIHTVIYYTDQGVLMTLINHLKTQSKQKRFHSPDDIESIWQLLYPQHFVNTLLIHHIKRQGEKEIAEVASVMSDGIIDHYDSLSTKIMHLSTIVIDQLDSKNLKKEISKISSYMRGGLVDHLNSLSILFKHLLRKRHDQLNFKTSKISDIFEPFQGRNGTIETPKFILIDGAPGMGKTTLCKEIACQWANGVLLEDIKMVFLVILRDPGIQRIHDLKDFIHYFYNFEPLYLDLSKQCAEMLTKRDNSDIMILMDGYDEVSTDALLIKEIMKRNILSQSKIVITSRPIASEKLYMLADIKVEVLGFTEESKKEYIQHELKDYPDKIKSLLSYLDSHDTINEVCYIPIMMTILVCTCKECEELPANQSELYERFITFAILRSLQKLDDKLPTNILSLHKLPEKYKAYLNQLAEFAFKRMQSDKVIFSNTDIESISPNLASYSKKLQGLGLLNAKEYSSIVLMDNLIWYNFIHLSIHEFLTAYYLNSLKISEHFQILKKTFFIERYFNVWMMFFGLQQKVAYKFHQFSAYLHIYGSSDLAKHQMKSILQKFSSCEMIKLDIRNIKGTFQLLCKNNSNDKLPLDVTDDTIHASIDFLYLFQFGFDGIGLFVSFCSVYNNDQLIELYLLDKIDGSYYTIITELKRNRNLSVMLVSNKTLIGYRCKYHQLTSAPSINKSLENVILRHCLINDEVANILSSHFITPHCLKHVHIINCKIKSNQALLIILQALAKNCQLKIINLHNNKINVTGKTVEDLANVVKNNPHLEQLCLHDINLKSTAAMILQALTGSSQLKTINLNDNKVTGAVVTDLVNVLKNNSGLEELSLSNNDLMVSAVVILQALKENSRLRILNLSKNNITEQVAKYLVNVIKNNTGIEQLYLSDNDLKESGIVILQALKENCHLEILDLSSSNMTGEIAKSLADVVKNNPDFQQLYLADACLNSKAAVILQALAKNSKLVLLDLRKNNMTGEVTEDLAHVIKNNLGLEVLCLSDNNLKSSAIVILEALAKLSRLVILDLNRNKMTEVVAECLANVIKNNLNLRQLGLSDNCLRSSAVVVFQALAEHLQLKVIDLSNNSITGEVAKDLAIIITNNSNLEELCLSDNDLKSSASVILQALKNNSQLKKLNLNSNSMSGKVAEDLANVIRSNSGLEQLYLSDNNLKSSAIVILQALKDNSQLKFLNLNSNNMTGKVAEDLANVIRNNSGLEQLCLSDNNLKSSAIVILQALKDNSQLKILNLNNNNMSEKVAEDLANVIRNNSGLEQLYLSDNGLKSSASIILQALRDNSQLKSLNLNNNNMSGKVVEDLADVIRNNSVLEQLCLSDNDFKLSAIVILKALKNVYKLKILNLNNNNMTTKIVQHLANVIKNNACLKQLFLSNNDLKTSAIVILRVLKDNSQLKILDLSKNKMTGQVSEDLANVIETKLGLEQLYLSHNDLKASAIVILQALKGNRHLEILDLNNNNMTEQVLKDLTNVIKNNLGLQQLRLSNNDLGSSAIVILQALTEHAQLNVLDLRGNNMTGEAALALANFIKNSLSLRQLGLSDNDLSSSAVVILHALTEHLQLEVLHLCNINMTMQVAECLADVIKNNTGLEQLYLSDNFLKTRILVILQALKNHFHLKILDLGCNNMTKLVSEDLANIIKNNLGLQQILLCDNDLRSSAFVILQALTEHVELKILDLRRNSMTREIAIYLADTIKNNLGLQQLYLSGNDLGSSAVVILQALIEHVQLQVLDFHGTNMTGQGTKVLADIIKNNSDIQVLDIGDNNLKASAVVILQSLKDKFQLKILNLSKSLTGGVVKDLAEILKYNSGLEQLYLSDNNFKSSAIIILQALKDSSHLEILELNNNNMTGKVAKDLAIVIKNNLGLKRIGLSYNNLKKSASLILRALEDNFQLVSLNLNGNYMTSHVSKDLANVIKNNLGLKELGLSYNNLKTSASIILRALKDNFQLVSLNLNGNYMTSLVSKDLANVINNNLNLQQLCLSDNHLRSSAVVIIQALAGHLQLKFLDLGGNQMTGAVAVELANVIKNNSGLKRLHLADNNFKSSAIFILHALKGYCHLGILDLNNNYMTKEVVKDLADVIKNNLDLQQLSLSYNDFKASATVILDALKDHFQLKSLNLNGNYMTELVSQDLANIIKHNLGLQELNLSDNNLRSSAVLIVQALINHVQLKALDLGRNKMTWKIAQDLASVIKTNSGLQQLDLSGNDLKASAVIILQALKDSCQLKSLNLNDNEMTGQVAEDLASVIKNNIGLQQLGISNNNLKTSAFVILQALQGNSQLKGLNLSQNNISGQVSQELANVIKNNQNLEQLFLSDNDLKASASVILQACNNSQLEVLDLSRNKITGEIAKDLAGVIKNNLNLQKLGIADSNLKALAIIIIQALKCNFHLRILDLSRNNMTGKVSEDLANVIKNNPDLEQLYLSDNELKASSSVILQALKDNSKLKVLDLNNNTMTGEVVNDLAVVIKNNLSLQKLCLSGNYFNSKAAVIFQALIKSSHLVVLDFSRNRMTRRVLEDLANVIKNNLNLRQLYLSDNDLRSSAVVIMQALTEHMQLEVLDFSGNNMNGQVAEDLANVIKNNLGLKLLNLSDNDLRTSATVILQGLKNNFQLQGLNLCRNNMTGQVSEALANVIKNNSDLQQLSLSNNELGSSAVIILKALADNFQLKSLNLNRNNMTEKVANDLANVIKNNLGLQQLGLSYNNLRSSATLVLRALTEHLQLKLLDLSGNNMTEHVAVALANVIKIISGLQQLNLSNNNFKSSAVIILQALADNRHLEVLDLNSNNMTEVVTKDLANVIKNNLGLKQLCLFDNDLSTSGVVILQALTEHMNLEILDLGKNNMTGQVAVALAKVLKNNLRLRQLYLSDNDLRSSAVVILRAITEHLQLEILDLCGNNMTEQVTEDIVSVIKSNSSLKKLYLSGNDLKLSVLKIFRALKDNSQLKNIVSDVHLILVKILIDLRFNEDCQIRILRT